MAINKNHEFEELSGVKCAIVEKNVLAERTQFLKELLELNKYSVVVADTPPPKQVPAPPPDAPPPPAPPATFTIGVTDLRFNPVNAIFGRLLKTREGDTVTLAYWQQKESVSRDDVPYYESSFQ